MIQYNVWFDFKPGVSEADELTKVREFLTDLKARGQVGRFTLLRNRAEGAATRLAKFQAQIEFDDDLAFGQPFKDVAEVGIHAGRHGVMIENVSTFIVEVFDEIG